jgi:hypothetical protein
VCVCLSVCVFDLSVCKYVGVGGGAVCWCEYFSFLSVLK